MKHLNLFHVYRRFFVLFDDCFLNTLTSLDKHFSKYNVEYLQGDRNDNLY